ncbi:MAG: hypothetical protein ABI321_10575 [Polyangia bacterium]
MTIPSSDEVKRLCVDLGFVDATGQLKRLDPVQRMILLVEAERALSAKSSVDRSDRDTFTSFDNLTRYFADSEVAPKPTPTSFEERMARAAVLAEPYRDRPGVIGAYLGGSGGMAGWLPLTDIDVFVVLEDAAFEKLSPAERQIRFTSEIPTNTDADLNLLPLSGQIALTRSGTDSFRSAFRHARILFGADDRLATVLSEIATLPPREIDLRLRVYFLEYAKSSWKAMKAMLEPDRVTARLQQLTALDAMRSILFVALGHFPTRRHCAANLRDVGVPERIIRAWETAVLSELPRFDELFVLIKEVLSTRGETFHLDSKALFDWAHYDPEAAEALYRWASAS